MDLALKRAYRVGMRIVLASLWLAPTGLQAERSAIDKEMILLIDHSGSMKDNDPENLRVEAAKSIIDQLIPGTFMTVIRFNGRADEDRTHSKIKSTPHVVARYEPREDVGEDRRAQAETQRKIEAALAERMGSLTDLHAAFNFALEQASAAKKEGRMPSVVLLTDGKIDLQGGASNKPYTEADKKSRNELLNVTIAQKYRTSEIPVYCMGFSENVDLNFLKEMVKKSAEYDERSAYLLFDELNPQSALRLGDFVTRILHPLEIPLSDAGKFVVDSSIESVVIRGPLSKEGHGIQIHLPAKHGTVTKKNWRDYPFVSMNQSLEQEVFAIRNVPPHLHGEWQIKAHDEGSVVGRVTVLAQSDTFLRVFTDRRTYSVGDDVVVRARLEGPLRRLLGEGDQGTVTARTSARIHWSPDYEGRSTNIEEFRLYDNGSDVHQDAEKGDLEFSGVFKAAMEGSHDIEVVFRDFDRENLKFKVRVQSGESLYLGSRQARVQLRVESRCLGDVIKPPLKAPDTTTLEALEKGGAR